MCTCRYVGIQKLLIRENFDKIKKKGKHLLCFGMPDMRYFTYFALPTFIMILVGIYLYFYFKRILNFFHKKTDGHRIRFFLAVFSMVLVLPAINIWSLQTVVVLHFFAFSLVIDFIWIIFKKFSKKNSLPVWRKLYECGILPIIGVILVLLGGWWNMIHPIETHYTIYTQKDIREEGYRIALISDLHFPTTMNLEKLHTYCEQISQTNPDFVVLCGDIVDEKTPRTQMIEVFPELASIKSTYGVFYVYGNHDRGRYSQHTQFTDGELREILKASGIHVLSDETYSINHDLTLIGREDRSVIRKSSKELLEEVNQETFLLLLDHQPRELTENDELEYDLQLSGHTHGGQIFPVGLFSELFARFGEMNYGYRQMEHMQVIVSSGIAGWGYAIRTGSHSEYVIIDLQKQSSTDMG